MGLWVGFQYLCSRDLTARTAVREVGRWHGRAGARGGEEARGRPYPMARRAHEAVPPEALPKASRHHEAPRKELLPRKSPVSTDTTAIRKARWP